MITGELWKPTYPLHLMLKVMSDQSHETKNAVMGLPIYGIFSNIVSNIRLWTGDRNMIIIISLFSFLYYYKA